VIVNTQDGIESAKKSDRLKRSMSARMQRQKAKAIKKLKELRQEAEAFRIFNKSNGK
tara:strand:+ start:392 stop:562 length:171 start_codon:yes stop_codon:yes gene_type:complete